MISANAALPIATSPVAATKASDHFPWDQLIPILPQLLGLLLLAAFLTLVGSKRLIKILRRIRKIGFGGFELELAEELDDLAASKDGSAAKDKKERHSQAARTARLLEDNRELLSCVRLLWVDDHPRNNLREMKILRRLCVQIDLAGTTELAEDALQRAVYDLVISDMSRGDDRRAGEQIALAIADSALQPQLIYYVGEERERPIGAFGLTSRTDELFRLIVEALKQRKSHLSER